jgi:hypothetical protein
MGEEKQLPQISEDQQREQDLNNLHKACLAVIGCNFDTVEIIATRVDAETGTVAAHVGIGNWYARYGSVVAWVKKNKP